MKRCYINGIGCVSAQKSIDTIFTDNVFVGERENCMEVQSPVYKDYISPVALRRMAKGVRNGIVASSIALKEADVNFVEAIITGTGIGCIEDSEKFLNLVLDNNEEYLTPISFIQSTHNAVGTQIALGLKCKSYNLTYANSAISFETALLDAKMLIEEGETLVVLVGGVDEMTKHTHDLFELAGIIKDSNHLAEPLLQSSTRGVVYGEGATFFVLEDKTKSSTYAELVDLEFVNCLEVEEVEHKIGEFLTLNSVSVDQIDAVIFGFNGDVETDLYYSHLSNGLFIKTPQLYYKHLCGEFNTASAFGLGVGVNVLKYQQIPHILKVNNLSNSCYRWVLLYNQYRGLDHSFVLLSSV